MYLPKRFFFVLLLCVLAFSSLLFFVQEAYAQSPQDAFYPSVQKFDQVKKDLQKEAAKDGKVRVSGQETNNYLLNSTLYNFTNMIGCTDPEICKPKETALGNVSQLIGMLYTNPPASGLAYMQNLFANAGLVQPVYAQGIGFAGLVPLLPLWQTTRNIAYMVIILIMVAIGFMVIFRMHIDPKTVISVQAALPKIVLTLILITLSYPIVGFMIDLMYLVMAIVIAVIAQGSGQSARIPEFQSYFMTANGWHLLGTIMTGGFAAALNLVIGQNLVNFGIADLLTLLGFFVANMWHPSGQAIAAGFLSLPIIIALIVFLGLLFTFIRLFLLLLNSYIQLLIALILGPLLLLAEAIPGRSAFTEWILNVIANLVVFPATVAVLLFAEYLANISTTSATGIFSPPLIGIPGGEGAFPFFLSLGVMFLAPTLVAQIKKLFHPKSALPLTAGTAFAPLTGTVQTGMGAASQFYYLQNMPGFNKLFGAQGKHQ